MKKNGTENDTVLLAHGDGGLLTRQLIEGLFLKYFNNEFISQMADAAVFDTAEGSMAFTTDSFVVNPVFFPGGDIGTLAVNGTVNDLAVSGARPRYITASFIIEEGLLMGELEKIAASMARSCAEAGVKIVSGDTKVVPRGNADKIFINTSGIGMIPASISPGPHRVKKGDKVIVNGSLGNHGLTVLSAREDFGLEGDLKSDCAPLNHITTKLWDSFPGVKVMRDLTRGGFATAAKEIAGECGADIYIEEEVLPVDGAVSSAAEILGLDPLYLANEGRFMAVVSPEDAAGAVEVMQQYKYGTGACIVGEVREGNGNVYLGTSLGGTRMLGFMAGSPLPRIC